VLNNCVLTGNLGNDPEVFYNSEGQPVASFNLAFRAGKKKTGWIRVTCFNKTASIVEQYLKTGDRIAVSGSLDYHQWETNEGAKRSTLQMFGNSIEFIKVKGAEGGNGEDETPF
jgi:single-strand DNA-binding protein